MIIKIHIFIKRYSFCTFWRQRERENIFINIRAGYILSHFINHFAAPKRNVTSLNFYVYISFFIPLSLYVRVFLFLQEKKIERKIVYAQPAMLNREQFVICDNNDYDDDDDWNEQPTHLLAFFGCHSIQMAFLFCCLLVFNHSISKNYRYFIVMLIEIYARTLVTHRTCNYSTLYNY